MVRRSLVVVGVGLTMLAVGVLMGSWVVPAGSAPAVPRSRSLVTGPLPVAADEELAVSVANSCGSVAQVKVRVKDGADGEVLLSQDASLPAKRGATLVMAPDAAVGLVVASVRITCTAEVAPSPIVSVIVRDAATDVPSLAGEVLEGTGI